MPKKSVGYDGEDVERYHPAALFRTGSVSSCSFQLSFSRRMALIRRKPPCSKSFPEGSPLSRMDQFSSVQSLSCVQLFATPWTAARQASLSITNSWSPPKPMSIESVMPSNHLILCRPLLLLSSIFPSIRVFSNESVLRIRWPKYWSFSFNIRPSNEHPGLSSFRMDLLDLLVVQGTLKSLLQTTVQKHQFFCPKLSF